MIEGRETLGKAVRLKYGMVGGGKGAFIGDVHRKAIAMDGKTELVAGCFSQSFENTLSTGDAWGVDRPRLYKTYEDMLKAEGRRQNKIDFVVIVTPNSSHHPIAKLAMENGIHVVCDKPLTTTLRDAEELGRLVKEKNILFCIGYAYAAYPIVKHMRDMARRGDLGEIRFVSGEYPQGWLAILLEYEGGAKGMHWSSQIAVGHDNGFRIRVYGTSAGMEWAQELPNRLKVSYLDRPTETISRGRDKMSARAQALSRIPSGHPEGYFECFAKLYSTYITASNKFETNQALTEDDLDFPGAEAGIQGVRFIEKCVESSKKGAVWVNF